MRCGIGKYPTLHAHATRGKSGVSRRPAATTRPTKDEGTGSALSRRKKGWQDLQGGRRPNMRSCNPTHPLVRSSARHHCDSFVCCGPR